MALDLFIVEDPGIDVEIESDELDLDVGQTVVPEFVKDYELLDNKPAINGHTLIGDQSFEDLGLVDATTEASGLMSAEDKTALDAIPETYVDWDHVDESLDDHSDNPIANAAVVAGLNDKQDMLTFDQTPTEGSNNPVTSDGITTAIADALETTMPNIAVVLSPLGITTEVFLLFRNFGEYTTFSQLSSSAEFAKAIQKSILVYYYNVSNLVTQAQIYLGIGTGISDQWNILFSDAITLGTDIVNGVYGKVEYAGGDWHLANWGFHTPEFKGYVDGEIIRIENLIPTKTSDLENDSGFITGITSGDVTDALGYTPYDSANPDGYVNVSEAANAAPVQSVNGQTGTVMLDADDVGALPDTTSIPTKTSDLQNDGSDGTSTYVETDELAIVATSGNYSDLNGTPTIPAAQVNSDWNANSGVAEILNKPTIPAAGIPAGGNAGQILKKTTATDYDVNWADQTQYYPSGYSTTAADKQTKQIACSAWTATAKSYLHILLTHANTYAGKIYFTVNAVNTYEVWINGAVSSATNYSLPAGTYIIYFDGSAFQVRTDGIIPASVNGTAARIPYGECDSTSTSTAFTATVPGITELKDGVTMLLYNGVVTSASGFTLNINGLGAKPSYNNMTLGNPVTPTNPTRDTTIFNINYAFLFVYSETLVSGGCWIGYRGYDANTNTIGYQLRTNNTTMPTADKFYRYRLLFTSADGTKWVPANTSTSTNTTAVRTPNTRAIDPFGEIVWYGTTTAIEANANVTAAQLWQEYYGSYTNIGYSFNNTGSAATMTANKPIYIVCTPQADGSAVIDSTTPYTQTLPSAADGKIYIYLGRAYNATNFEILMNHPVYYHNGENIVIYDGHMEIKLLSTNYDISGSLGSTTLALDSSLFKELEFDVKGPRTALVSSTTYAERRRYKVPVSEGGFVISDYNFANVIMNDIAVYWSGTTVSHQNSTSPLLPGYTIEQIIGHI